MNQDTDWIDDLLETVVSAANERGYNPTQLASVCAGIVIMMVIKTGNRELADEIMQSMQKDINEGFEELETSKLN